MVEEFSTKSTRIKPYEIAVEALERLDSLVSWISRFDGEDVCPITIVFLEGTNVEREQFFGSHFAQYWYTRNDYSYVDPPEEEIQRELDSYAEPQDWILLKYRISFRGDAEYMEILVHRIGRTRDSKWNFRVEEYDIGGLGISGETLPPSTWKTADEAQDIEPVSKPISSPD